VETWARPLDREMPLLDEPLDDLDPLLVDPLLVDPPVVDFAVAVGTGVAGVVVVASVEDGASVFGVPAYVSAASQANPAVPTSPMTAVAAVSSVRRRVASVRRAVRARRSGVIGRC